jgi:hypothetical protein
MLTTKWPRPTAKRLSDDLIKLYASFGIDLPKFEGDDSWRLRVPARIVLAKGGARN